MNFSELEFKRRFSLSMYKDLKIPLGEMSFLKDFVNDTRGDLYPVVSKSEDCRESVSYNLYTVSSGGVTRLFCQFFPFATYELTFSADSAMAGFSFALPSSNALICVKKDVLICRCSGNLTEKELTPAELPLRTLVVSCRPGAFDVYFKNNEKCEYFYTFYEDSFKDSNVGSVFSNSYVHLVAEGASVISQVCAYIDNGVSIADIRPIKYENSEVLMQEGKLYFTASVRMQESSFQGIFSWVPGTTLFSMTGAVFYDCGDGRWRGYVAPVLIYNRQSRMWNVWVSSFEHEHILAYSSFEGDVRFGVNLIDVTIMDKAADPCELTAFAGIKGDEDPDIFYDEQNRRWLMAICRIDPKTRQYVYVFFESKDPFKDYTFIGKGYDGAETGGSFVKIGSELCFICGNDFSSRSQYRIYSKDKMEIAKFNYSDGGFRGWGSIIPVKAGSRIRYYWLTFDRHNGSTYNWSYGNIYCFEATL